MANLKLNLIPRLGKIASLYVHIVQSEKLPEIYGPFTISSFHYTKTTSLIGDSEFSGGVLLVVACYSM